MSVMYIRNEQTGEFEPVPSLVGPQGPPGANGDGAGTVTSVNKVAPNATGNVTLTAANVGARPDTWTPTASDVGALPSDGTAANANQLNGKSADQYMLKTDTAADSNKLGGADASEYVKKTDIPSTSNPLDAHPVGSLYMSKNSTSPASLFGGTWAALEQGIFPVSAGVDYVPRDGQSSEGGANTVTLTEPQLPSLTGDITMHGAGAGGTVVAGATGVFYSKTTEDGYRDAGDVKTGATSVSSIGFSVGGNQPHENRPEYKAYYMWERVS